MRIVVPLIVLAIASVPLTAAAETPASWTTTLQTIAADASKCADANAKLAVPSKGGITALKSGDDFEKKLKELEALNKATDVQLSKIEKSASFTCDLTSETSTLNAMAAAMNSIESAKILDANLKLRKDQALSDGKTKLTKANEIHTKLADAYAAIAKDAKTMLGLFADVNAAK